MNRELQELARTDALTGLANRRAFDETLKAEFLRSRRFLTPAALLMIDIDHFKTINDAYGHDMGDRALVALAATLKTTARTTDLSARVGGEEFVLLLAGTTLAGGMELAERLRHAAACIEVAAANESFGFTTSIGVTIISSPRPRLVGSRRACRSSDVSRQSPPAQPGRKRDLTPPSAALASSRSTPGENRLTRVVDRVRPARFFTDPTAEILTVTARPLSGKR